ncbi:hypothetical protein B0H66DRAFT_9621 [Apodospora peruviana]|uniref:Uncharacterized protein n=1 Tax=Apodospora peruviana TaxID=516989 RepID=A0AAE0IPW8_9PEZI|nr:hypothetical protein B0H66DRAFT_9621 [Apodospora peruviana]
MQIISLSVLLTGAAFAVTLAAANPIPLPLLDCFEKCTQKDNQCQARCMHTVPLEEPTTLDIRTALAVPASAPPVAVRTSSS